MNYHIARDNQQLGTFSREDVLARYHRGEFRPTDLAWCEGMTDWKPVLELFGPAPAPAGAAATSAPPAAPAAPTYPAATVPVAPVGAPQVASGLPPKPDNFLVWSILSTLLCCLPFGIVAIVYSSQVDSKYTGGDYAGAIDSAKKAKMWAMISAGISLGIGAVYVIFMVVMGIAAAAAGSM